MAAYELTMYEQVPPVYDVVLLDGPGRRGFFDAQASRDTIMRGACQFVRVFSEFLTIVTRLHMPGGESGYPMDVKPYDRRVTCTRPTRQVRIEKL